MAPVFAHISTHSRRLHGLEREGDITLSSQHRSEMQKAVDVCIRDYRFAWTERPDTLHPTRVKIGKHLTSIVQALNAFETLELDQLTEIMILLGPKGRELVRNPDGPSSSAYRREIIQQRDELERIRLLIQPMAERAKVGLADADTHKRAKHPPISAHMYRLALASGETYKSAGGNAGASKDYDRPFARFLKTLWSRLPRPYRERSAGGFVDAYNDAIKHRRAAEKSAQKRRTQKTLEQKRAKRARKSLLLEMTADLAAVWEAAQTCTSKSDET